MQHTSTDQDILIQHTDLGRRLARLLQSEAARTVLRGQAVFWRIPHSREVDALLVELVDLFISFRYAHLASVQLELAMNEGRSTTEEPTKPRRPHSLRRTPTLRCPCNLATSRDICRAPGNGV